MWSRAVWPVSAGRTDLVPSADALGAAVAGVAGPAGTGGSSPGAITTLAASVPTSARAAIVHGDYRLTKANCSTRTFPRSPPSSTGRWRLSAIRDPPRDAVRLPRVGPALRRDHAGPRSGGRVSDSSPCRPIRRDDRHRPVRRRPDQLSAASKLAVIAESIAARHRQGATVGDGFDRFVELAPLMIDRARGHRANGDRGVAKGGLREREL